MNQYWRVQRCKGAKSQRDVQKLKLQPCLSCDLVVGNWGMIELAVSVGSLKFCYFAEFLVEGVS